MRVYFQQRLIGATWPPPDIKTFDPWDIPLINTSNPYCLSGTTVTWAHHAMLENDRKSLDKWFSAYSVFRFYFFMFSSIRIPPCNIHYRWKYLWFNILYGNRFSWFSCNYRNNFFSSMFIRSMKGHSNTRLITLDLKQQLGIGIL